MQGQELTDWANARLADFRLVDVPVVDDVTDRPPPDYRHMVPAHASLLLGEAVVVKFKQPEMTQDAFNMAVSLLPSHVDLYASKEAGGPGWIHIPADISTREDPFGQFGYVGWRWERSLQPGEYITRARLHEVGAARCTFRDILVTAETLPALRASGKYAEINTPRALRAAAD